MRFWTSDHHFGHRNIITYSGRPYVEPYYPYAPDPAAMTEDLVARHNSVVPNGSDVWFLGDLTLSHDPSWVLTSVKEMCGVKMFTPGNHDVNFKKPAKDELYSDVFDKILHGTTQVQLDNGCKVFVSHFPYQGDSIGRERHQNMRPVDDGESWLIHGHVHEKWRVNGRQINVGVDAWGGYPVSEETIIRIIKDGPAHLPPLSW